MYDSGIRGASDIVKALALGAKFVFVGRLWVWGLSIMGEHGVRHVMKSLLSDLDIMFNTSRLKVSDIIYADQAEQNSAMSDAGLYQSDYLFA